MVRPPKPSPKEEMKNFIVEYVMNRTKAVIEGLDINRVVKDAFWAWKEINKEIDKEFSNHE